MPTRPLVPIPGETLGNPGNIQDGGPTVDGLLPFIPAHHAAKAYVRFLTDTQPSENVLWWWTDGRVWTATSLATLNAAIITAWVAHLLPLQASNLQMIQVESTAWENATGDPIAITDFPANTFGLNTTTAPAPADNCIGIALETGFRGRSFHGRFFAGGMVVGDFAQSLPFTSSSTAWETAFAAFISDVNTASGTHLSVVSFQSGKKRRSAAQVVIVAAIVAGEFIYTMRRRLPGHNRHR